MLFRSQSVQVWDLAQEVVEVGVGDRLCLGLVDTGAHQTVMNTATVQHVGLEWEPADKGIFGQYSVVGRQLLSYIGRLKHLVQLQFGEGVSCTLSGVCLIDHPNPIFLIGHDVLCSGCAPHK